MKERKLPLLSIFFIFYALIILINISFIQSKLSCEPDFKSQGDNYNSLDDPQDSSEYFYGYEFAHRAGDQEYYDRWKGVYWDNQKFCYKAYDNFTLPESLDEITDDVVVSQTVVSDLEPTPTEDSYVILNHTQSNLVNLHNKMCMTQKYDNVHPPEYEYGEYELLLKMDKTFEDDYIETPHHFYFTIENPSDDNVTFSFKVRNFVNITENMNATLYDWGPNPEECLEEEVTDAPVVTNAPTDPPAEIPEDDTDVSNDNTTSNDTEAQVTEQVTDEPTQEPTDEPTDPPTQEPCEREIIILNETRLEWTEEYPIPEIFYITNNYTIEPHSSLTVNLSLTFRKNTNITEGGYFVISGETRESDKPFYWPEMPETSGRSQKLSNMEIILESDLPVGLSTFSLMRRREEETKSHLGDKCSYYNQDTLEVLNGVCGDGFFCKANNTCEQCKKKECKECSTENENGPCTQCYMISVEGQWNVPGGRDTSGSLKCDLDYIDLANFKVNEGRGIIVPPAIHWRVTLDFWIWISDPLVLMDSKTNMNIIYKDFMAITLRCTQEGLKIYATPIEWLYEYPTIDEDEKIKIASSEEGKFYKKFVKPLKDENIVEFLTYTVGSYNKVTIEDLVKNPSSNWVYIRYAFNLDSSKQYLNDLPESNLRVPQIFTGQTGMPFHMKKFYGRHNMTYLYFQNFYRPLSPELDGEKNITIYFRNLNIFREYIPQSIITKYYNLHKIPTPNTFPQLMVSMPFGEVVRKGKDGDNDMYEMKGYNYYMRDDSGIVRDDFLTAPNITTYKLRLNETVKTLRPPRNFWRLNFLELNKQPETCDFESFKDIQCNNPKDYCFEDNKAFICIDSSESYDAVKKPYYLDIFTFECHTYCPFGYMHPPRYSTKEERLYCNHYCDVGNKQCPSDDYKYTDIYTNFLCSNNFFNLYYKCFNKEESLNNVDFTGIFFSTFLWTPSIFIDLGKTYTEFAIDFWFYPENRLMFRKYNETTNTTKFKNRKEKEEQLKQVIFWSDCCKVVYQNHEGGGEVNMVKFYQGNTLKDPPRKGQYPDLLDKFNWNHFVLTYFYSVQNGFYTYYITFKNSQFVDNGVDYNTYTLKYGRWQAVNNVKLSQIVFCTHDHNFIWGNQNIFKKPCKDADWLDGFYRKLQIFDLTYSTKHPTFFAHHFEDDGLNGMLKHRYIYGLNSVVDNHLIDLIGGSNGYVPWVTHEVDAVQNPDRTNYIIYETNYAPLGGIPSWGSSLTINDFSYTASELLINGTQTHNDQRCLIFQDSGNCLQCKPGYALFTKICKGNENNQQQRATYYYKNPGKNMPERLSLNMDFEKIKSSRYFTIFFFIKLYGLVKDAPITEDGFVKLIIFHEERNAQGEITEEFYLGWTTSRDKPNNAEKMFFYYNGQKLFSFPYYRERNFGYWVPVSFAAFRENDRLFQINMAQASILYDDLPLDNDEGGYKRTEYFPYVKFTQFTITNYWVGLLSDVKIYNRFVINAWGIVRHEHETIGQARDDVPDSAIEEIDLKSETVETCLNPNQILNEPSSSYQIECVPDYNPHFNHSCGSMEAQTVRGHMTDGYRELCSACCGGYSLSRCLGGHDVCGDYEVNQSCETQSPVWKNWYPSWGDGFIRCRYVYYIDYNRFKYAKVGKVSSPQDVWAIDFWFYTGTCHAVYKRTGGLSLSLSDYNKRYNANNFKEFVMEWNYHIKIRVRAEKTDDNPQNNTYAYYAECTPIVVKEHPDLDSPEVYISKYPKDIHYSWQFVTCGVNFQEKIFYQTTNNRFTYEIPFTSKLVTIPAENTYFEFHENSPSGYGFTFVHQLRLWHCYNCAHAFRNLDYQVNDKNFNAVYHNFDGRNSGVGPVEVFRDSAGRSESTNMYQAADFPGYTVRYGYGDPVLCDETIYNYYDEDSNSCQRHYNIARMPTDYYKTIPSSRNARYSMEFWFFVENSAELSPGVNLLWEYHMSITLLRDTSNKNTINAICFPQSYRDNVDGKGGQEIVDLFDNALNKDKFAFYQGSNMWNFVRCSVDQTRKLFYINDNIQLDLEGEVLYGTARNYRPFRYFKINAYHKLKFQNAHANPTRIFLRQIRCYRDFIDYRLMNMKFLKCGDNKNTDGFWISQCKFWPIAFCFDYNELISANWPCIHSRDCFKCPGRENCGLIYHIYHEEPNEQDIRTEITHWRALLQEDDDVYYPTFPDIYLPQYCYHGQTGGNKIKCENGPNYCRMQDSTDFFWPNTGGKYLELETLTLTSECKDACRPPDSYNARNYCFIVKSTNNMLNCEYIVSRANGYNYYEKNYECKPGYKKVYYECIDKNIIPYSAMYFSNVYSFPNVVFSASDKSKETLPYEDWKIESRLASYYVEIWMKFDALNYRDEIIEIEHYLYAHPHQIIKDPVDQKYKYSNIIISQGSYYYTLTSMSDYEWNKVIIENLYDIDANRFDIKFYLNYEFDNPELSIPNLDGAIYKLHFRGFGFCDKTDSYCRINDEPAYLRWGVAWYRYFRVWDADITSLPLIQACEYGYTQLINAQKYYFPLTVDYIEKNTITSRIDPDGKNKMVLNYWIFYQGQEYKEAFDNAMRENYSTDNFDKTFVEENNYISGITDDGTDYIISACANECKRCYSSSNVDCYECRLGYSIYGKQCKVRTGYFYKTPPDNDYYSKVEFKTTQKDIDGYFYINEVNPITIALYIKFFGIELSKVIPGKLHYPLVCFYNNTIGGNPDECLTFIGYNYDDKTIVFVVNGNEIYASKAKPYVGVWTHFGISIHHQWDNDHFPNMLNFMIDQEVLIPKLTSPIFDPTTEIVNLNCFTIYNEPICYYSSFKVFRAFYFGPYGHLNAVASTRGKKLEYQISLYGSSSSNCITDQDLAKFYSTSDALNVQLLQPVCVPDYQPYEDTNNICSDDDHFMDVIYKTNPPCELCDSYCITNCFHYESSECTCDYYEGLYWVKTDEQYQLYECQKVDSINFAFFEKVTLYGLTVVKNDEMTMAFWLDVYEYLDNRFESLEIIWNQHLAVIVKGNGMTGNDKYMIIECHGDYDISSLNPNIGQSIIKDEGRLLFNRWNYIVCQADKFHEEMRVNKIPGPYTAVTYSENLLTTSLTIEDKTTNFNYGFSFVRELKLFSSYNFDFWNESLHNLQPKHFQYLLHSFNNRFSGDKISESKITDIVEGLVTRLTLKSDRIGYNYIINYQNLVICEEGYVYNSVTNLCDIHDSQECYIPRTAEDKCLVCGSQRPYLKDDDKCYSDCRPNYYADDYFQQCRSCNFTCYTCFGKKYNNCLSCTGIYYYIESLHVCVTNCQEYGLVISTKLANTCEELVTESSITIPVYLNNSYDYNPKNEDFVSKIVNRDEFTQIKGQLGYISTTVETEWIYNWNKTVELNRDYRYFSIDDIPDENPITSSPSNLLISVNTDYFKYGYKYVFDLEIYSRNGEFSTNHTHTYILMMNDYPLVGLINVLPAEGYITYLFLMTINKCKDDVSEKSELRYKFSYFVHEADIVDGDEPTSDNEIIIQDWSRNSEVLFKFPELNPEEGNKYYIRGYCRDKWGIYYSEIQEVTVNDIPTNGGPDLTLEDGLASIDLDEDLTPEQLSNRAEFLATTTVDFEKGLDIINRTNVTDFNKRGIWQQNLIINDPTSSQRDLYCNGRANSYIIYYYLICDCNGYEGSMCQIDAPSFDSTIEIYDKLFTKVKTMQTIHYNKYLINSVNLLMKSGAQFMPIENMDFMLESIDFINLYRNKFQTEMMEGNNYEIYFDIYNSLIEYGLSIVNKLKYRNFIAQNSKNSENMYNAEKFRNATLKKGQPEVVQNYFNKVKVSLQSLLDFYSMNKKELRFINRNINVYVSLINENFAFDTFFNLEKKLYEPYMDFRRCLENVMIKSKGTPSYRVFLNAIVWKVSPYMSEQVLYWDTTSPIISFKFLDYDKGEKIYLSNCGNTDNQIQLYFPVKTYRYVDRINRQRAYLSPENQYDLDDDIFCDPVYINASGAVFNSTPEERRNKYFLGFNFSCKYYKVASEDKNDISLTTDTLDYHRYTKENYVQCLADKLIQEAYGEFVVDSYLLPNDFHINSRFFYLKHYMLLMWNPNYDQNQAFYFFIAAVAVYAFLSLAYIYFEKKHVIEMERLGPIKSEMAKINIPYRDEYIFNNDLNIEEEIKGRLKDKRKPDMEEMNLDTNNLDVGIMADEITRYNKGYKNEDNALNFNPKYFGIKEKPKTNFNSKYFPGEVDLRKNINPDDEIDPERFEKMKKFYHVGFKGLDPKELRKKEMKINQDKKRIIVSNKELDEISEEEDDENYERRMKYKRDDEEDEKETHINYKKSREQKYQDNMNKYKDYVSSTGEHLESEANLKGSKRTTKTKKFFGSNPPRRGEAGGPIMSSMIFSEKDQQKQAKSNAAFFGNKLEDDTKNKRKEKNLFQKDYDNLYKANFKGPKVVSENLGFYNRDTIDFEQEMDSENQNPPYFGHRFRKLKKNDEDRGKGENAGLRVGFLYKGKQIDLEDNEEKLPPLAKELTFEKRMEEFHDYSARFSFFLYKNIKSRHILITTFDKKSMIYERYQRAGDFAAQLSMFAFFLSIFFTADAKQTAYLTGNKDEIMNFILYCFLSDIGGCFVAHLPAYCFWINDRKFRKLYHTIREDGGITVLKETEDILYKGRIFWKILGVIIQVILIITGFYFAFGFCATYYYQRTTYCLALICTLLWDFFISEFAWEILIGFLFYFRDVGRVIVFFGTLFNKLRDIKHLAQ